MSELVFVAGARPNFVKIAPIMRALARTELVGELVDTGQHYSYELRDLFFEQLGIAPPTVQLHVGSETHGVQTGRIMEAFDRFLQRRASPPRAVVVVGDVNSTMACALVATKRELPVVHVEAGLRSFDRSMPEEINRVVTDAVADLLLVSEPAGLENLAREGVAVDRVRYVGNVMIDSLVEHLDRARTLAVPARYGLNAHAYAVVTLHRPSNVDSAARLAALVDLVTRFAGELPVMFPAHPRTAAKLEQFQLREQLVAHPQLRVLPPLGYDEFIGLLDGAQIVVTDSGGIQEETTYLGVPCITLRSNTERPITVTQGTNALVGDDLDRAWSVFHERLTARRTTPCEIRGWDGHAAERIVDELQSMRG